MNSPKNSLNQIETYLHSQGVAATAIRFWKVSFGIFLIDTSILCLMAGGIKPHFRHS